MNLGRRLVGDTIVYGFAFALARALSFALLPILTRAFAAEEFGAYDLVISFSRGMLVLAALGMETGVALLLQGRDPSGQQRAIGSYLLVQTLWGALVVAPAIAAAPWLSEILFGGPGRTGLVALGAGFALVQALTLAIVAIAKWTRRPAAYLVLSVGAVGSASVLAASFAIFGNWGAEGALAGSLLGMATFTPMAAVVRYGSAIPAASRADMTACLRLGLPFVAIGASEHLLFPVLVRMLLVAYTGLLGVGIFGAASTICLAIMIVNESFASAWWPYAISEEGASRIREDTRRVMRLYSFLLMLPVGAAALVAEPLVVVVLGRGSFEAAAGLIGPMAFAYWIKSVRQNSSVGLVVSGQIWIRAFLNFSAFAASLALAFACTPIWGVAGAVWGFAAGEAVGLLIQAAVLHRFYDHRLDLGSLAIMAGAFVALVGLVGIAAPAELWALVLARCAMGGAFLGLLLTAIPLGEVRKVVAALGHLAAGLMRR
jgi:O-antigen/teichoic acid export membrane protein